MTDKEEIVLNAIINYYQDNKLMPSVRYLMNKLGYKSPNSIYQYLIKLQEKGYLIRNSLGKLILSNIGKMDNKVIINVPIINTLENIRMEFNNRKAYIGFKILHNYFNDYFIRKNDYLIIEKDSKLKNGDLGLFIINKKYRIMTYYYQDGFYILKDKDQEILYKVQIIGKVVRVYRKM